MAKTIKDKRLPKGISIYLNNYEEYVAIEFGEVARIRNINVRAGKTVDEAVDNYLKEINPNE